MAGRKKPKYIVGIDLGTTNSAVAYANIASAKRYGPRAVKVLPIPQLVAAAQVGPAEMLPSSLYLPPEHDQRTRFRLPWTGESDPEYVVGRFAQAQGAKVPGRLVTSAKSWLSYGGVDRTASILPWGAGDEVPKVSPVVASARFLEHIVQAWGEAFPKAPLAEQDVVLTSAIIWCSLRSHRRPSMITFEPTRPPFRMIHVRCWPWLLMSGEAPPTSH